jgi:hypothetical protein
MHWSGGILGRCDRLGKPYLPVAARFLPPVVEGRSFRDWSVMNARKTNGFLATRPNSAAGHPKIARKPVA